MLDAITGWTLFGGLVLSGGAVSTRWFVVPRSRIGRESVDAGLLRGTADAGLTGAALVFVGLALFFVRQLGEFRDPFVPWIEDATLLLGTPWGSSWKAAVAGTLASAAGLGLARRGARSGWVLATLLVLALGAFPGLTGHAAGVERFRTPMLILDAIHVWAAGAWIGGLAIVLWLARRGDGALADLVPAFSPVAMAAVAALSLTGVVAAWTHLPTIGALFSPGYGRTLLVKLSLVAVVLVLGARNYRVLSPGLGSDDGDQRLRRSATLELAVAQAVLIATAILVRTSPTGH